MKVLWLASWYPSRLHATNGDFVERQARAVAAYTQVAILFVAKDEQLTNGVVEVEQSVEQGIPIYRVYYGKSRWGGWIERLLSVWQYRKLQKKYYQQIEAEWGRPDLVHVQVAIKAGILARWLQQKRQIPYVLTEHWTGYYRQSVPSVYMQNPLLRQLNKLVLQDARVFMPVSADLGKTIQQNFVQKDYTVVPNVVDTSLFNYQPHHADVFRFIHPSYLNYQKNPQGMLRACRIVAQAQRKFEVFFIGGSNTVLEQMAADMGLLNTIVFFKPAVPYAEVAKQMQQSHALLLFSRFENLPCVVLEALCCGLPVISSRVGGLAEVIDSSNGMLVPEGDEAALADAMCSMIDGYTGFNRLTIAATASARFSYEAAGQQVAAVYHKVLQK